MNHAARWADGHDIRGTAIRLFVHNVERLNNTLHGEVKPEGPTLQRAFGNLMKDFFPRWWCSVT